MAWKRMRRFYVLGLLYVVVSLDAHAAWLSFDIQNEDGQSLPCRIHLLIPMANRNGLPACRFGAITLYVRERPSLSCRLAAIATRSSAAPSTND